MIDIEKDKWCLQPDVLHILAQNMEKNGQIEPTVLETGVKEFNINLRSQMVSDLFYLIEIRTGPYGGEIRILLADNSSKERTKVYENGIILRWGSWVVELLETLPQLIARESKKAATTKEGDADLETVLFELLEKRIEDQYYGKREDLDELKSIDRSGMPVNLLY